MLKVRSPMVFSVSLADDARLAGEKIPLATLEDEDVREPAAQVRAPVLLAQLAACAGPDDLAAHDDADVPGDADAFDGALEALARHPALREHVHEHGLPQDAIRRAVQDVVLVHELALRLRIPLHDDAHLLGIRGAEPVHAREL